MNQHDYYISESNYTSYDNNSKNKFKYYIIKKKSRKYQGEIQKSE